MMHFQHSFLLEALSYQKNSLFFFYLLDANRTGGTQKQFSQQSLSRAQLEMLLLLPANSLNLSEQIVRRRAGSVGCHSDRSGDSSGGHHCWTSTAPTDKSPDIKFTLFRCLSPRIMKLPVVRYSPVGAVLET